jgi:hypothetical protein
VSPFDLTPEEQGNVRAAVRCLRAKYGSWETLAKLLRADRKTLWGKTPGVMTAFRIARVVGVPVDDVLAGRYPGPEVCRHCGHSRDEAMSSAAE